MFSAYHEIQDKSEGVQMGNGKASGAILYLDNLLEKGKAPQGSITPLRIAFTKVLQAVDGETWSEADVRSIDVEDYMARFANLTMGKYTTDSLTAYKSRLNKTVTWYINFLDKPGWTPELQKREKSSRPRAQKAGAKALPDASITPALNVKPAEELQSMPAVANSPGRVLYPYPLLDGQLIHLSLPLRLGKDDAKRIGMFVESIAIDASAKAVQ